MLSFKSLNSKGGTTSGCAVRHTDTSPSSCYESELIPDHSPRLVREKKTTDGRVGGVIWDQLF